MKCWTFDKSGSTLVMEGPFKIRMRRTLHAILLLGGSMIFTLALAEAVLRFGPRLLPVEIQNSIQVTPSNLGVSHPYIGYLHKPHSTGLIAHRDFTAVHHTDGYGFRNAWPWPDRAEIVAVGDSVTFGYGVEDEQAWPSLLAKSLPKSRVINLGLIGASPEQYARVYETFGVKLRPKVLLVGFWVRNDFWDAEMFDLWLSSGVGGNYKVWRDFGRPKVVGFSLEHPLTSLKETLRWKSLLLGSESYVFNLFLYLKAARKRQSQQRSVWSANGIQVQLLPEDFLEKTVGAWPERRQFHLVLRALKRIHSIARKRNTQVVIVFQPSKEEVYLPLLGESIPDAGRPLREALQWLGISYLDLTPMFREHAAQGENLYFETDGHPNARGYALIEEGVLLHLRENAKKYGLS